MSESNVKGEGHQGRKISHCTAIAPPPAAMEWNTLAANDVTAAADGTIPSLSGGGGVISAACVRFVW